jgi:hypothetical protein
MMRLCPHPVGRTIGVSHRVGAFSLLGSGLYTAAGRAFPTSWSAAFAFPDCALRGASGGETMTTPGGAGTLCMRTDNYLRARHIGFYHGVGAPTSSPSFLPIVHGVVYSQILCPSPMPQGVSYVHVSRLGSYIRKQMPIRAPAGLSRVQSKPLPGRARISHPPARPDLFTQRRRRGILRTSSFGHSRKFALKEFCELRIDGVLRSSL